MTGIYIRTLLKSLFQSPEARAQTYNAKKMADELISGAQEEWSRQLEAVVNIPDLITSPRKYAEVLKGRGIVEIKTAYLLGYFTERSRSYDFPTSPEQRGAILLMNLLHREGASSYKARAEVIALRRVLENGDRRTLSIVERGEAAVRYPDFHPHLVDIVTHLAKIEAS